MGSELFYTSQLAYGIHYLKQSSPSNAKIFFKKEVKSHFIDVLLKNERDVFNYTLISVQAGPDFFWCCI